MTDEELTGLVKEAFGKELRRQLHITPWDRFDKILLFSLVVVFVAILAVNFYVVFVYKG